MLAPAVRADEMVEARSFAHLLIHSLSLSIEVLNAWRDTRGLN
jgi:hypothetical protein